MVAGLIDLTDGEIWFDDRLVNNVPTHRRHIGLAFQSHALFPHMSVAKNIAFGLSVKGVDKKQIKNRVEEMLDMIELTAYADRMPAQLSGGQQQRVALARMLATDPASAALRRATLGARSQPARHAQVLDPRAAAADEKDGDLRHARPIRGLRDLGPHLRHELGRIEQAGTQLDIYLRPASEFVADFVGDNNTLNGTVMSIDGVSGETRTATVKTSSATLTAFAPPDIGPATRSSPSLGRRISSDPAEWRRRGGTGCAAGIVDQIVFEGPTVRLVVDVEWHSDQGDGRRTGASHASGSGAA